MKHLLILIFILFSSFIQAQNLTITGTVSNKETGEKLLGAYLYIKELKTGVVTNSFGFYSLSLPKDTLISVSCSYTGYEKQTIEFKLKTDNVHNFRLIQANEIEEISVKAKSNKSLDNPITSINSITISQLKNMPSISGENDVLLAFQMMPGVQGGNEGTGALFVRGGSADQNLYLIDDVPLYYVNHLGGFVSVFDENAINSVKLYKAGFPAQYSGKLSSILDIRLKDGNNKEINGEVKFDILASKIYVEGPILDKKATFIVSLRRCNFDLITRSLFRDNEPNGKGVYGYSFIDFNTKINIPLSEKDAISIFSYYGRDRMFTQFKGTSSPFDSPFEYEELWKTRWGNKLFGLKWSHIITSKLFANINLATTNFNYENSFSTEEFSSETGELTYENRNKTASGINDLIAKVNIDYYPWLKHKITTGASVTKHKFSPSSTHIYQTGSQKMDTVLGDTEIKAMEYNTFLSYESQIGNRFSFNAGINLSYYTTDSLKYLKYQPRISTNFKIADFLSFKASFSKMTQNSHLLSSSNIGLPNDMWLPATNFAKPENSDVFTAALVGITKNIEISGEFFYKTMNNLIDFKEASNFSQNSSWANKIETEGSGISHGFEFLIQKNSGKFNGWLSYTWSKTDRQFENINKGNSFAFKFDRRHDFSIVLNYKLSKKIALSATWVYASGYPITVGIGQYNIVEIQNHIDYSNYSQFTNYNELFKTINQDVIFYGGKNNYRMPAYHRLDVGAVFTKQKKHGKAQIKLGIYNVYNQNNPYFLYYEYDYNEEKLKLYQFCLFPIIPSFSYSYSF